MSSTDAMVEYVGKVTKPLLESLRNELPDNNDPQSLKQLKELVSYAESQRANLAVLKRRVDEVCEERRKELVQEFEILHEKDDKKPTKEIRYVYVIGGIAREISTQNFLE